MIAATAAACSGGSGSGSSAPTASSSGPAQPTYTIAKPGTELHLGDISVRIMKIEWRRHVDVQVELPGTRVYAIVRLRVANTGDTPGTITPTQFWLLDSNRREFLTSRKPDVPDPLVGRTIKPGAAAAGQLVFGVPHRILSGSVLVYQFKDARAIAAATHVGLVQFVPK